MWHGLPDSVSTLIDTASWIAIWKLSWFHLMKHSCRKHSYYMSTTKSSLFFYYELLVLQTKENGSSVISIYQKGHTQYVKWSCLSFICTLACHYSMFNSCILYLWQWENEEVRLSCIYQGICELLFDVEILKWWYISHHRNGLTSLGGIYSPSDASRCL